MFRKCKEKLNIFVVKKPSYAILIGILLLNLLLFVVSALVISSLAPASLEDSGFWASAFYTICMVLDAGCISNVIADIGETSVGLIIACLATVLIGMIIFTGAVIGYVTNGISNFIENAKSGKKALQISGHTLILNWNSRASEIINDMLYKNRKEVIVILVSRDAELVEREINDRISDTIHREKLKNKLTIIVREGDTYLTKQLEDVSILTAKTVIILSKSIQNTTCRYDFDERREKLEHGNANTVKTLVQVAELTASAASADDQIVVVEVEDDWTGRLVDKIIAHKERLGKCNIIPVPVNRVLGQILSQFSIMPELNAVYSNLFSNKGAEFFCRDLDAVGSFCMDAAVSVHDHAIPLATVKTKTGPAAIYVAEEEGDIEKTSTEAVAAVDVHLNPAYRMEKKNIIIIGHNSKSHEIMNGFDAFRAEWNDADGEEILDILVIDDAKSLDKQNRYREYSYVSNVIEADVFEAEKIIAAINAFADSHVGDTSVLILSDDTVPNEDIDANALTYLIYIQDIISKRLADDPDFDIKSLDVIVEILNPKNYDVVHSFSANNVIISNRYISKMVTQISEKEELYEFYSDILTYDEEGASSYESNELYIKPIRDFFTECPPPCTAAELIRAVYKSSPDDNKSILIGYVDQKGESILFSGNQRKIPLALHADEKLILFANH